MEQDLNEQVDFLQMKVAALTKKLAILEHNSKDLNHRYEEACNYVNTLNNQYLFTARINVTQNYMDHMHGAEVFAGATEGMAYTDNLELVLAHFDDRNKAIYKSVFTREALFKAFEEGRSEVSAEVYYQTENGDFCWCKNVAHLVHQPDTGDLMAFATQIDLTRERILETILNNVVLQGCDYIMCIRGLENAVTVININTQRVDAEEMYNSNNYLKTLRAYAKKYVQIEDREAFITFCTPEQIWQSLKDQDSCTQTFCLKINGEYRYKKLDFYCLNREYKLLVHVRTDITEAYSFKQEQEKKLFQALELAEKANKAKTKFLSSMSHDIRTPMNAIIGLTQLAYADMNDKTRIRNDLDKINEASHYLLQLLNNVLDLSKIESDRLVLRQDIYKIDEFTSFLNSVIVPLCKKKNINFSFDFTLKDIRDIIVDRDRFNQIFVNVIGNAVKYTEPGGNISLIIETVLLDKGRERATYTIKDTGRGMSEDFLQKIFQSFIREDESHTTEGTGLGMAITKSIVDSMGGTIVVKSKKGIGTTVIVTLTVPLATTAQSNAADRRAKQIPTHKRFKHQRILVVEDNEINTEIICLMLERQGFSVVCARNGQEAIDTVKKDNDFAAIFMDIRMPVMDGLTAARTIKALPDRQTVSIPIIAMTANAFEEDKRETRDAGMAAHLTKPIETKDLMAILYEILE